MNRFESSFKPIKKYLSTSLLGMAALLVGASPAFAADAPSLGAASSFAVLSAAPGGLGAVTCIDSTINGDVGSSGASATVTQPNCAITGAIIPPVSATVLTDFNSAYAALADSTKYPCTGALDTAYTNATLRLTPGVYCNSAGVTFTGTTLTLDAQGNANAVWIFKIGTDGAGALAGTDFSVLMVNGGQPSNVYWWVAEAVKMTTSGFQGTILAGAAITVTGLAGTPATTPFNGNALAKAAVTLTDVTVTSRKASGGGNSQSTCNQGVGNGPESCDPGNSNNQWPFGGSNDQMGGTPGNPGRKGGSK